jgi:hypothetical protein
VLDKNEAEKRLRFALQREVNRAVEILAVSQRDADIERKGLTYAGRKLVKKETISNPGPDQVAFAGTKESVEVPEAGTKAKSRKER